MMSAFFPNHHTDQAIILLFGTEILRPDISKLVTHTHTHKRCMPICKLLRFVCIQMSWSLRLDQTVIKIFQTNSRPQWSRHLRNINEHRNGETLTAASVVARVLGLARVVERTGRAEAAEEENDREDERDREHEDGHQEQDAGRNLCKHRKRHYY